MPSIPFNRPFLSGREYEYVKAAVATGHISGAGPYTAKCEKLLQEILGSCRVLLTTSCTDALEMAALLLNIQPGDEVIVPSFTFVSTINAFVLRGARPVFCDIRPDTLNLDEEQVESLVTPHTKAILAVHYAGVACEMDTLRSIAKRTAVTIVEDNAHGLFGRYGSTPLATLGSLATLSFHETKNISCGEGGALVINDSEYHDRAQILREKGTNRVRFARGEVSKYTWVDLGSSFLPSDLLAAFLMAQLEARHEIQVARKRIWQHYKTHLQRWATENNIRLPVVPPDREQSYHMFYLLMPANDQRDAFIHHMANHDILAVFHYVPLHSSPMARQLNSRGGLYCR